MPNRSRSDSPSVEHRQRHAGIGGLSESKSRNFVCTNNALDPRLKNGARLWRPSECHRRGVGAGLHVKLSPDEEQDIIRKWTGEYKKIIDQSYLYYGDKQAPPGKHHATLAQCVARGFAIGARKRAESLKQQRRVNHTS